MKVHTYVIQHDKGFAPNPFWGVCTLACCKPQIREHAKKGDVIIGFGSKSRGLENKAIYWMRVEEIILFDEYWEDSRFATKRSVRGGSLMAWYGDNIYHRNKDTNEWIQEHSFHKDGEECGKGNLKRDVCRTEQVLIGRDYAYWGGSGPEVPRNLYGVVPLGRAWRCRYSDADRDKLLTWIGSFPDRGFLAEPADWCRDHKSSLK